MVQAFTISFDFEGKTHLALVSLKKGVGEELLYAVRVYDDSLTRIVPEGCIRYSSIKPLCPQSLQHPRALKLFSCIDEALNGHLQVCQRH